MLIACQSWHIPKSKGSMFTILHDSLRMRKLFPKWVSRLFTPDQKQQRVEDSERCLKLFKRGKKDFLLRYVTMTETWIHHYTPEVMGRRDALVKGRPCYRESRYRESRVYYQWLLHGITGSFERRNREKTVEWLY